MKTFDFYSLYKQKSMQSNKNRKVGIANRPIFPIKVKNPK